MLKSLSKLLVNKKCQKPKRVFWWLTPICNLRCNHCDIGKNTCLPKYKPVLSLKKKKEIILKLEKWLEKPYSLSFIAGEPFLHKGMIELLSFASKHGAKTSVTSNGTLISHYLMAKKIVKSGLNFIALSLDSYSSKIHDKSRGGVGVRDRVMMAVKNLKKAKKELGFEYPYIYINSIIMRNNLKELIKLTKWVKKEKLDGITFQPIATTDFFGGDGKAGQDWYKTSPLWPDKRNSMKFVDSLEKMKKRGYPIQNSNNDFRRFREYFNDPVKFGTTESCEQELESMIVGKDGVVKMCPALKESFGNVLFDDLDKMWSSKAASRARKHVYECTSQCKILANNKEDFYF